MVLDVKNIVFSKICGFLTNTQPKEMIDRFTGCNTNQYFSFGYFDYLNIVELDISDSENILTKIDRINTELLKNITDKYFFHPISCFATDDIINKDMIDVFWNESYPFFCTVFVSFDENCYEDMYTVLEKCQNEIKSAKNIVYKTLNITDAVVFLKSESINDILTAVQELYKVKGVGYGSFIVNVDLESTPPLINDINTFSIEVFERNKNKIENFCEDMNRIFNYDSFSIFFNGSNYTLNQILQANSATIFEYANFLNSNVCDRPALIHTNICSAITLNFHEGNPILKQKYISLESTYKNIIGDLTDYLPWIKTLGTLLNTLVNMCDDYLFSPICMILYKTMDYTVRSFVATKGHSDYNISKFQTYFVQRLVRGSWQFLDNILKKDATRLVDPVVTPLPYNVDVKVIEYYHTVFYKTVEYLNKIDELQKKYNLNELDLAVNCNLDENVCCLIVPKVCRRMKTHVHGELSMDTLLFIDLPINILYEPLITIESIVHETAHCWGDFGRCRRKRFDSFCKCLAIELSYDLGLYSNNVAKLIENHLVKLYNPHFLHFDSLYNVMLDIIPAYVLNQNFMADLIATYFEEVEKEYSLKASDIPAIEKKIDIVISESRDIFKPQKFETMIWDLYNFYRECYADLVMIKLLDLSIEQYLKMFLSEVKGTSAFNHSIALLVQRISMVIFVAFGKKAEFKFDLDDEIFFFYDCIKSFYNNIVFAVNQNHSVSSDQRYYNIDTSLVIIHFLKECLICMENSTNTFTREEKTTIEEKLKSLRDCFSNITNNRKLFDNRFYKFINDGRNLMINA